VGAVSLYYDDNGNLTDDGTYDYEYDIFNRLILAEYNSVSIGQYYYDHGGRRIAKDVGGTVTKYAYDGAQVVAEYDGTDTLLRKFVYGPGIDEAICMIAVDDQNETRCYYHYDGLGSVIALSNIDGDIVEAYSYNVYGAPTIYTSAGADGIWRTSDDTTATVSAIGNPYMFTARRYDAETGLYYYRTRMYSPAIGRFLQTDPLEYWDSMNLYQYCANNPVNWIDPWGLSTVKIILVNRKVITLVDPTNKQFQDAITSQKKGSIQEIRISGHGSPSLMCIEKGAGEGLFYDKASGQIVYSDDYNRIFADDVRDKLAKDARIVFDGCNTAREIPFIIDDNIAKQASRELPETTVEGNKGYGAGNEISNPRNRNQFIRIGKETHVIGFKRSYKNGQVQ